MEGRTVLVLEDELLLRDMVSTALEEDGWIVLQAATGIEAVQEIVTAERLDALFTDIRVPGSVDGWGVAEVFRAHFPQGAVIYATGFSATRTPVSGSMFFRKPYKLRQVVLCLDALTRNSPGSW